MVVKRATLAGRKRTKDLSESITDHSNDVSKNTEILDSKLHISIKDVTADKHLEIKKLKSDIEPKLTPKLTPKLKSKSKSNHNSNPTSKHKNIINNNDKPESVDKALVPINIKSNINSIVRLYKRNAEAGTRFTLKYTRFEQREIILERIDVMIKEYSDYGQEIGLNRAENMISCQAYADQIYQALSKAGAPLQPLLVSDPLV